MHLYHFRLLLSFFMYKRAQLVCAWGQNWVCTQGIVYSLGHFKAFIQHTFDCIVCGIFGAWTPYSVPRRVKPALPYTTPSACVPGISVPLQCWKRSLQTSLTFAYLQFGIHSVAMHFVWSLCWYQMQTGKRCPLDTNHLLASIKNMDWCRQCSWMISSMWSLNLGVSFVRGMNWSLFQPLWVKEGRNDSYWKWWPKNRFCCPL